MQQELPGLESPAENTADISLQDMLTNADVDPGQHDCLVMTPNQPLAQQLRRIRLQNLGVTSAKGGTIVVLSAWLAESIANISDYPLATENQLLWLWEKALASTQAEFPELDPKTLAPQALSAWQNLKKYELAMDELRTAEIGQLVRFSDSVREFETLLRRNKLSTVELEIEACLAKELRHDHSHQKACLYAFVEAPPPLIQRWLEYRFERIDRLEYLPMASETFLYSATDQTEELKAASRWASQILTHPQQPSDARVGIVHSNLGAELNSAVRIVTGELAEGIEFSTSLKLPLSQLGIIAGALDLLEMNQEQLDCARARRIIQSPFWSEFKSEYEVRAHWERDLCHLQSRQIKSRQLQEFFTEEFSPAAKQLQQRLLKFSETKRRKTKSQTPLEWADLFHQQMQILGWPGTAINNEDATLIDAWYGALQQFAQLGTLAKRLELGQALRQLRRCCDKRRTDPTAAHIGIRLLDTIEGAADYTHLWVIGMGNDQWPATTAPNPLLPAGLQRKKKLPRSCPTQETLLAQKLIDRASNAALQTVFSYAKTVEGLELKPSALLPELTALQAPTTEPVAEARPSPSIQIVQTQFAPPLAEHEKQVRGGASLLRTMAASPFDAFAQWRLGAEPLPEPKTGLDAAERGTLVHWVLDAVWKQLKDSVSLQNLTDGEAALLCDTHAKTEVQRWQRQYGWLGKSHQELEIQRLSRLVQRWLVIEAERPAFEVRESETSLSAQLGELSFKLRLDRLDQLADGKLMLIDYKTGQGISPNSWLDLPPSEPQLPLYAISLDHPPHAICFAQVRPDQMRLLGIGQTGFNSGFKDIENWNELVDLWRSSLGELATDYAAGLARADETTSVFGRQDPLAPLHRMNEQDSLSHYLESHSD